MSDTKANEINKNASKNQPERPRMTKPVTGEFNKNKKKLGGMIKSHRASKGKTDVR